MTVAALSRKIVCTLTAGLAVSACVPPHAMTPDAPTGRTCPDRDAHTWYSPVEAGDNARLEAWCRTVGPPVVRATPSGEFPPLAPGDDLGVLSWNVAAGGGDLTRFIGAEAGVACDGAESRLESGSGHVVLLLQEAFRRSRELPPVTDEGLVPRAAAEEDRPGDRPDVIEVAQRCGLSLAYVAAARNGLPEGGAEAEDRGVAILSTAPLSDIIFIELPYEAARRVAVAAVLRDTAGRGVRLIDVHLISAAPPSRALVTGNGSRVRQGLAVADALSLMEEGGARDGEPGGHALSVLLAGDFNTWSERESTLRRLREVFPDSPPVLRLPTRGPFPTDHILFRRGPADGPSIVGSTYARVEDPYHSDHHPVGVDIRFPD